MVVWHVHISTLDASCSLILHSNELRSSVSLLGQQDSSASSGFLSVLRGAPANSTARTLALYGLYLYVRTFYRCVLHSFE